MTEQKKSMTAMAKHLLRSFAFFSLFVDKIICALRNDQKIFYGLPSPQKCDSITN